MSDEIHVNPEEEAGLRGGASAAYVPAGVRAEPMERGLLLKDRVRWAAVWGGYVVALSIQLWLTAIGFAIFGPQAAGAAAVGAVPTGPTTGLILWAGVAGLIALFIGGLLASRLAGIAGTDNGFWNGVVLWGLSFTILMILMSLGAAGILGVVAGSTGPTPARPGATGQALMSAATGAWWFVVFQFLGLVAAAGGGTAGARPVVEEVQPR